MAGIAVLADGLRVFYMRQLILYKNLNNLFKIATIFKMCMQWNFWERVGLEIIKNVIAVYINFLFIHFPYTPPPNAPP